jgi:predicted membrane metal-binding protein
MKKELKTPTDRSFAYTFAVVLAIVGAWLVWKANSFYWLALGFSAAFAVVGAVRPRVLHPLNVVWMRFGLALNFIVSPIVLGTIYLVLFVPTGFLFRILKRDALRRAWQPDLATYWVDRTPPGPESNSLARQF